MFEMYDELICQLFHGRWAEVVSYSRQGRWACAKPGCRAQMRHRQPRLPGRFGPLVQSPRGRLAGRAFHKLVGAA